jgi:hypothetical protein
MKKHERLQDTHCGADIETTSDARNIDASVLAWGASATRAVVADKIAAELIIARISWYHGATSDANLLSSLWPNGDHAVDLWDSGSNSGSLNTREERLSFNTEELLWLVMINSES